MLPLQMSRAMVVALIVLWALGCDDRTQQAQGTLTHNAQAVAASAQAPATGGFTGVFHSIGDGKRSVLNLTARGDALTGLLDAANISATIDGQRAAGELREAGTAMQLGNVELILNGDEIVLKLTALNPKGTGLELPPVTYRRGAPPPIDLTLDALLIGRWRHTWSGEAAGGDVWLLVNSDGSIEHGRVSPHTQGELQGVSIDSSAEDGLAGRWRTSDRTLHVLPSGKSQWFPFARYEAGSDKLVLIFNDGSRQVYYRQ